MAFSRVASQSVWAEAGGVDFDTMAFPNPVVAGNLIVVGIGAYSPGTLNVSDTRSSVYDTDVQPAAAGDYNAAISTALAASSGACTVTVNPSNMGLFSWGIDEFQAGAAIQLDVEGGATGNSASASKSLSTTSANGLMLGVVCGGEFNAYPNPWTMTPHADYTQIAENQATLVAPFSCIFRILSAGGTHTPQWDVTSDHWAVYARAFREQSTAGKALLWTPSRHMAHLIGR